MRLIKPKKLGYLQRCYGIGQDYHYVASPLVFFDLYSGEVLVENQQWGKVSSQLGAVPLDEGFPKLNGEFCVAGKGYAYREGAIKAEVEVQVKDCKKTLAITGQRQWKNNLLFGRFPSEAKKISAPVALDWQHAWGGQDFDNNPLGTGFHKNAALPQVEYPVKHARSPGEKLPPASFLPCPLNWPQRSQYQGNYGGNWFETSFPAFAKDTHPRLFSACVADQQIDGFFRGGEHCVLKGFHPSQQEIHPVIPQLTVRTFVCVNSELKELSTRADTLWLLPEIGMGVLIFRAKMSIENTEASEISGVLLAYEEPGCQRSFDHYQRVYKLRTDSAQAHHHVMNESQLSPEPSEQQKQLRQQKIAQQRQEKKAKLQQRQQHITGSHPALATTALPEPELTPMDDILPEDLASGNIDLSPVLAHAEQKTAEAEKQGQERLQQLKEQFPHQQPLTASLSQDQAMTQIDSGQSGDQQQHQAQLAAQLTLQSNSQLKVDQATQVALRQALLSKTQAEQPVSKLNLTGADLSGLVFTGLDFSQTIFSFCNLSKTQFFDCKFDQAAFSQANLNGTRFEHCELTTAKFVHAAGTLTHFTSCDLSQSHWSGCQVEKARFEHCTLSNVTLLQSALNHCVFNTCTLSKSTFNRCDLKHSEWTECPVNSVTYSECSLQMSHWLKCEIQRSVMQMCSMQLMVVEEIVCHKWVFSTDSDLTRSLWIKVKGEQTSLRSVNAMGCRLDQCQLSQFDFSLASMTWCSVNQSRITSSVFANTDLTQAQVTNSNLYRSRFRATQLNGATLQNSDFYEADFMWAQWGNCTLDQCRHFSKVAARDLKHRQQEVA